ncbi:MAG: proton-conducting transporter transmembrane domain-containing protein [Candidatus Dormibacteria bacterium]
MIQEQVLFDLAWLCPALPAVACLLLLSTRTKRGSAWTSIGATALSLLLALGLLASEARHASSHASIYRWIDLPTGGLVAAQQVLLPIHSVVDPLTSICLVAVLLGSLLAQLFSLTQMRGEDTYIRFYRELSLLTFGAAYLVMSGSFFTALLFSGVTTLAAFLLVAHRWDEAAGNAGRRVLVTMLAADAALLVAVAYLQTRYAELTFGSLASLYGNHRAGLVGLTAAGLLVTLWAMVRLAAFPLHQWVADTREAPPAAAGLLTGSVGMVGAAYVLARAYPLLASSGITLAVLATVGGFAVLFSAALALAQVDLRRLVAYLAGVQGGLVLLAFGLGAYDAAVLTAIVQGWARILLVVAAAAVVRAMRTDDVRQMGGVRGRMRITALASLAAVLAASGVVPLAGFFPLAGIMAAYFSSNLLLVGVFALPGIVLAGMALGRLYGLVFTGNMLERRSFEPKRVREVRPPAQVALALLAVLAVAGAWDALPWKGSPGPLGWFNHFVLYGSIPALSAAGTGPLAAAVLLPLAGLGLGFATYSLRVVSPEALRSALGPLGTWTSDGFRFEGLGVAVDRILGRASDGTEMLERRVVVPATELVGEAVGYAGEGLRGVLPE